jgi:hypothetical protein
LQSSCAYQPFFSIGFSIDKTMAVLYNEPKPTVHQSDAKSKPTSSFLAINQASLFPFVYTRQANSSLQRQQHVADGSPPGLSFAPAIGIAKADPHVQSSE